MTRIDLKAKVLALPHKPGVYVMKDQLGAIIYVGKAKDLKNRVSTYFRRSSSMRASLKTRALIDSIVDFDIHLVRNEQESLLLESKLIKEYRPRYNVLMRDDKHFYVARVRLNDEIPRFSLTRQRKDDGARYFGPFPHSVALVATLDWLNREFGLRVCQAACPDESDFKHCSADIIRNCTAPCVGKISLPSYHQRVEDAIRLLEGKGKRDVFDRLKEQMLTAAEALDFEKAAQLRDIMQNLEVTLTEKRQFFRRLPTTVRPTEDLQQLADFLGLEQAPTIMECFDISNVSSNHIVASMVRFTHGQPDNSQYRRYRIRSVEGQNDFASMAEVIRRRYSRILNENVAFEPTDDYKQQNDPISKPLLSKIPRKGSVVLPDLIIVDGGKGQLSTAVHELNNLGISDVSIIGLAKQHEEVYFPGESEPLRIPHHLGALKLLQRIRDEAHRFANNYNELLYRRRMRESILDECPTMTTLKKQRLLSTFGSVARIRKADIEDISAISGITKTSAEAILHFLNPNH